MSSNDMEVFPFFALPKELRNDIYYFAILGPTPSSYVPSSYPSEPSRYHRINVLFPLSQTFKSLRLVSRQTRAEAESIFFTHPHALFKYDSSINVGVETVLRSPAPFHSHIQRLEISLTQFYVDYHFVRDENFDNGKESHPKCNSFQIKRVLNALPDLKMLRMGIAVDFDDFLSLKGLEEWCAWNLAKDIRPVLERVDKVLVRAQLSGGEAWDETDDQCCAEVGNFLAEKRNLGEAIERAKSSGVRTGEIVLEKGKHTLSHPNSQDVQLGRMRDRSLIIRRGIGGRIGTEQGDRGDDIEESALEVRTYMVGKSGMTTGLSHAGPLLFEVEAQAEWERQQKLWPMWS